MRASVLLPGATIGILGGGQLGRMSALAARRLGYRVRVLDTGPGGPAMQVADGSVVAQWDDLAALEAFGQSVDVATIEFENIPSAAAGRVGTTTRLRPGAEVLHLCQNRLRERTFLDGGGCPQPAFRVVGSAAALAGAMEELGGPCVLKTVESGYDGKGQVRISGVREAESIWAAWGGKRGIVEEWIDFECELSVVCARSEEGHVLSFPPSENIHTSHILDLSIVPGRFGPEVVAEARRIAEGVARDLGVVGLLAVEFFLGRDGRLRVNELAPRPHNSGHYTLDACLTSQFEQHVRAVCGLPLGDTRLLSPVVMGNLLGELWSRGEPDWAGLLEDPRVKLHLYGKAQARSGRKMGHFCVVDESVDAALEGALELRHRLRSRAGLD